MSQFESRARKPLSLGSLQRLRAAGRKLIRVALRRLPVRLPPDSGREPALVPVPVRSGVRRHPGA